MNIEGIPSETEPDIPKVERITSGDLKPEIPEVGGVEIILQRNAKDNRDLNSELEMGALVPEAALEVRLKAKDFFGELFQSLGPEEAKTVDILVVAADTKLETPVPEVKSDHKRAVETAEQVVAGIGESMEESSLPETQLLNKSGKPIELSSGRLRDLRMLEDSPDFVKFLTDKYGTGNEFWAAFESDMERETREEMGAEGPDDIADRVEKYLKVLTNAARSYHQHHPGRRLVVWAVSHYDTISPYVKKHVAGMEQTDYLPVEQGAGLVINVDKNEKAATKIQNHEYNLKL